MDDREIAQKIANFADAAKQLGSHTGQALGTAAATGAVALVGVAVSKLYDAATKARDYRSMLAANPEVQEFAKTNPTRAGALFTSLRNINPEFSKDPFVAGEYMRRFSEYPGREGGYMIEAAEHRSKFTDPVLDTYLKGGLEGAKVRGAQSLPWGAKPGNKPRSEEAPPDDGWTPPTGWKPPGPRGPGPQWRPGGNNRP